VQNTVCYVRLTSI